MTTSSDEQIRKLEAQRNRIEERLKQLQAKQRRLKRKQSDGWKRKTGETLLQYAAILPENDEQQHCLKTALNTHVTVNGKDVTIANLLHSTYAMIVKDREEQEGNSSSSSATADENRTRTRQIVRKPPSRHPPRTTSRPPAKR